MNTLELESCPVCGAKAYLFHDEVDGIELGYSVGCPCHCLNDGIKNQTLETAEEKNFPKHYFASAEKAAEWWNGRVTDSD